MADLADVEVALVELVTTALYPDGLGFSSAAGVDCRIYRGWPGSAGLDSDLKAGKVNVTVFPDSAPGQTTTRYEPVWREAGRTPTLIGTVSGDAIRFSGSADVGQIVGIQVDKYCFVYRTRPADTPGLIAANLAALIRIRRIVQLSGASLIVPGASSVEVRITADSAIMMEVRRQSHDLRLSCWCPNPSLRDGVATLIDTALASRTFIKLPDSSQGRLIYKNSTVFDQSQSAALYRRDLMYTVEYPTILSASLPAMTFGELVLNTTTVSV